METVVVAGHVCVDITPAVVGERLPAPGEMAAAGPVTITVGGCVGNTGRTLAELGVAARLNGLVGDDQLGAIAIALLDRAGLDVEGVSPSVGGSTSYSIVLDPPGGDRAFLHHVGANADFRIDSVDLAGASALHVGYPTALPRLWDSDGGELRTLLERARQAGILTSLDFSTVIPGTDAADVDWAGWLRAVLPLVDIVSPSIADLRSMIGDAAPDSAAAARWLIDAGAAIALVTAGGAGLRVAVTADARLRADFPLPRVREESGRSFVVPVEEITPIVTTGAGDAASGGFLAALLAGDTPSSAARFASRVAATVVSGRRVAESSRI